MISRICFIVLLLTKVGFSQPHLDTVFCDTKNTSYIVFEEEVSLIDIGNPEDYVAQVKENIVFVKPLRENVSPTTFLIKTDKKIYYGTLVFNAKKKKYFYDMKGESKNPNTPTQNLNTTNIPEGTNAKSTDLPLKQKLADFGTIKNEINTLGFISSNMDGAVTVIRNDDKNTYLKFVVKNKTSIPFKLDFISFQYYQDMKKGTLRKSKKAPLDVFPLAEPTIKEIGPGTTEALLYVIPTYALANNGYLMVLVRESSGDRVLKIKISGSTIQKSPQLYN